MKKFLKWLGFSLLALILILAILYLYYTDFGRRKLFSFEPRRPKIEIPITYNIGWWSDQDQLKIEGFKIDIVESKLSLFNSKSLISYSVSGKFQNHNKSESFIKEVHFCERLTKDTIQNIERIIEITPVVGSRENKSIKEGFQDFNFTNEHTITSGHWGINRIKFICGENEQIIEFLQRK